MPSKKKFFINKKKEFIVTYARDFVHLKNKNVLYEGLKKLIEENKFEYIIGEEHNKSGNLHYHVYFKSLKKNGFNTTDERCFDVPLPSRIISFKSVTGACEEQRLFSDFLCNEDKVKQYCNEKQYNNYLILKNAHCNIVFKGDKNYEWAKDTESMIDYVTKEDKNPLSNFDWKSLLEKLRKGNTTEKKMTKRDELGYEFFNWLVQEKDSGKTKEEIWNLIQKNPDYVYVAYSNINNTEKVINNLFKNENAPKPVPFYGVYYLPRELGEFLDYLDNWIRLWYTEIIWKLEENKELKFETLWESFVKKYNERPRSCYIYGEACSGKTSLLACFYSFSHWCNGWNPNNYNQRTAFNFFDDYDGMCGGGNWDKSDFSYLKPWMGCQQLVSISGKYITPRTVKNHKPCVFISNFKINERFPEDSALNYFKDFGLINVELKGKLYENKNRRSIGGFCKYVEYDTRNTWVYKNLINKKEEEIIEISSSPVDIVDLTAEDDGSIVLIKDDPDAEILLNDLDEEIVPANSNALGRQNGPSGWISSLFNKSRKRTRKGKEPSLSQQEFTKRRKEKR